MGTKAVKYNIFPWLSGLSEAVTAARRTARSGVRTKARRTARSAYNNYYVDSRPSLEGKTIERHTLFLASGTIDGCIPTSDSGIVMVDGRC